MNCPTECSICLDYDVELFNMCVDTSDEHSKTCKQCLEGHIKSTISSAYNGTCPTVYCPCLHQNKEKKPLKYKDWSQVAELISFADQFENLAKGLVSFRCGECHEQSSIFVDYSKTKKSEAKFKAYFNEQTYCKIRKSLKQYVRGEIQVDEIYMSVTAELRTLEKTNSKVKVDDTFKNFLSFIRNPERRINLYLRYLRDNPKVKSNCCKANHCFNCKTHGFHEGKKCEEVEENFCNDVLKCPGCGISLVKGEGCDTITCVCGRTFSWEWEKVEGVKYRRFLAQYPDDTHVHCAEVLCKNNTKRNFNNLLYFGQSQISIPDELVWYNIHRLEVSKNFSAIFERLYIKHKPYIYAVLSHSDYISNHWIKEGKNEFFKSNQKENSKISELVSRHIEQVKILHEHILDIFSGGSLEEKYKILNDKSTFSCLLPSFFKYHLRIYLSTFSTERKIINAKRIQSFFYLYRNRIIKLEDGSPATQKCVVLDNQEHQKLFNSLKYSAVMLLNNACPIFTSSDIPMDALKINDPNKWVEICNEENENSDYEDRDSDTEENDDSDYEDRDSDTEENDDSDIEENESPSTDLLSTDSVTITFDNPNDLNCEKNKKMSNLKLVQSILSDQENFFPKEPKSISLNCLANFFDIREIIYDIFNIDSKLRKHNTGLNNVNSRYGKNRKKEPTWNEICSALAWYVHNHKVIDVHDSPHDYDKWMTLPKIIKTVDKAMVFHNGIDVAI